MPPIKVNVTITSFSVNKLNYIVKALKKDNSLIYYEQDEKKTKVLYDYEKKSLIRENDELYMLYKFDYQKETEGLLKIKPLNKAIKLPLKTKKIEVNGDNVEIEFFIDKEKINYKLEVL